MVSAPLGCVYRVLSYGLVKRQAASDKLVGAGALLIAAFVFVYYTLWALILVSNAPRPLLFETSTTVSFPLPAVLPPRAPDP